MLHGLDYHDFRTNALQRVRDAANHVLGLEDGRRRFADVVLATMQAFALCCTLDRAAEYRDEIAFFQAVRMVPTKGNPASTLDDEEGTCAATTDFEGCGFAGSGRHILRLRIEEAQCGHTLR